MADSLMLIFRALIYQADRKPGMAFTADLQRGLHLRLTRSTETENYKLECGRKRKHVEMPELVTVVANWPIKIITPVEWRKIECEVPTEIHWMAAIMKPLPAEGK